MALSGGHAIRLLELLLGGVFMVITALGLLPAIAAFPWDRRTTTTILVLNVLRNLPDLGGPAGVGVLQPWPLSVEPLLHRPRLPNVCCQPRSRG